MKESVTLKKKSLVFGLVVVAALATAPQVLANEIDLTSAGASGLLGDALVIQGSGGAGTGKFPAFVQISGSGNADVTEAYNTTVNNVLNNGAPDNFNHEITVSDLVLVDVGGSAYYRFLLDINENDNSTDQYLSLDDLIVLTSTTANQALTDPTGLGTVRFDMSPDDVVLLDYSLEAGSGNYDMAFLLPTSYFAGALPTDFVYLYSKFGGLGEVLDDNEDIRNFGASAGFEEWALGPTVTQVPEPATALLFGLGLAGAARLRRRRQARQ